MSDNKWVYSFGGGGADGDASLRELLGGKGANLAEMARLGLPVPPGFTISTEVCTHFTTSSGGYPEALEGQVAAALERVEGLMEKRFGDPANP
ncbi:MAG TPA: pyruvate, phosphate dikinase, partial [Acidobacteria bacterium]|nr:pyruvate, phosphate dikinase [Acidobacteriota bacterium]